MSNSRKTSLIALRDYILANSIAIDKTKSRKGMMIYNVDQVQDINKLSQLAESCTSEDGTPWAVRKFDAVWDTTVQPPVVKQQARLYIGPKPKSKFAITDKTSLDNYLDSL